MSPRECFERMYILLFEDYFSINRNGYVIGTDRSNIFSSFLNHCNNQVAAATATSNRGQPRIRNSRALARSGADL